MSRGRTLLLACVAGTAIANNYAVQPALGTVAADLGVPLSVVGLVPTAALAGCVTGFALLLPLADHVAAHRLVAAQLTALAGALVLAAVAPGAPLLLVAYLLIGAAAGVAAQAGAIAGRHAAPERRGSAVAMVAAGLSAGILLSRLVGGALTGLLGWRRMLLAFALLALLGALAAALLLPRERPYAKPHGKPHGKPHEEPHGKPGEKPHETPHEKPHDKPGENPGGGPTDQPGGQSSNEPDPAPSYRATLRSLPRLLVRHRPLRWAVVVGGLWYFAFNLVWITLALALARPPYSLGPAAIGLYSLAGLLGFVALPFTGRLSDRFAARTVITGSVLVAAGGVALLAVGLGDPWLTAAGLALFDAGCFAAQAANQSRVIALEPARAGSLGSVYLVLYFAVGAVGTACAAPLLDALGWGGTTSVALGALLVAASLTAFRRVEVS